MLTSPADSLPADELAGSNYWRTVSHSILKILVFVLSPILLFRITQGLVLHSFIFITFPNPGADKPFFLRAAAEGWMRPTVVFGAVILPAACLAIAYYVVAKRFGVSRSWTITPFVLLAIVSASVFCNVQLSDVAGESRICLGAATSLVGWHTLQAVFPLMLCWWLTRQERPRGAISDSL